MKTEKYRVTGMTCAACQANVARAAQRVEGVEKADVNLIAGQMSVTYDETLTDAQAIIGAVTAVGYGISSMEIFEEFFGRETLEFQFINNAVLDLVAERVTLVD